MKQIDKKISRCYLNVIVDLEKPIMVQLTLTIIVKVCLKFQ